jgi:SH3-like domain-containing protein
MKSGILIFCLLLGGFPAAGHAQQTACKIYAYVIDKDPQGLNVRKGAGTNFAVAGKILPDEDGVIVDVIASAGGWLKIENAETVGGDSAFSGSGWVFASLLATTTRMKTKLYAAPSAKSRALADLPGEEEVSLLACRGAWAKVRYGSRQGWLAPDAQCGNPVTTCP